MSVVPWDDPDATRLCAEQQAELAARYDGEEDIEPVLPAGEMLATVLLTVGGAPVACGALRQAEQYGRGFGELKRMFVRPAHRGQGLSRVVLSTLEGLAVDAGLRRLLLETGLRQHEALNLYRSSGYRRIPGYGPYVDEPTSVCYARWLVPDAGTRVLVLSGTLGAGKSTVAAAVGDLLEARRVPHTVVDVDALCQVWPRPDADPYAQGLALESLAAIAPGLAARGLRHVVLARVVEDAGDRGRYEMAFDGADVTVVRLVAGDATRRDRLTARGPAGPRLDWELARSAELDDLLTARAVDDAVVDNDGREPQDAADDALAAAGW